MNMEDLLTCNLAVCQEEIDTLTFYTGISDGLCKAHRHRKKMLAGLLIHIGQVSAVLPGNNYKLTVIDRLDIHESDDKVILIYDASGSSIGNNVTEYAVAHCAETLNIA